MSSPTSIQLESLNNIFDGLVRELPEVKRKAVEAAGEAVKRSLNAQIRSADLSGIEAKGRVSAWQQIRLGSGGGWAAISPMKGTVYSWDRRANFGDRVRQHTWHGKAMTAGLLTMLLERGHSVGVRGYTAKDRLKYRRDLAPARKGGWGSTHVAGRQFYAYTKVDAQEVALKAADKVLCRIADEVDF